MRVFGRSLLLAVIVATFVAACAPTSRPAGDAAAPSAPAASPAQSAGPKLLTVAVNKEPSTIQGFTGGGASAGRGNTEGSFLHSQLVVADSDDVLRPQLATEVPSFENGTWRINPDGSMDMTWKLRADATWHDGTPFTSADLMFTFKVYKDRDLPQPYTQLAQLMESATAPDATTFQVHWRKVDTRAAQGLALSPLPKHLLEELYLTGDKDTFANSARFTDDFVGLGPFRLVRWERGSQMEFARYDRYFLGRAPLDTVIVRYIGDPNTMVANVLAGAVDLVLPPSVDLDGALELKRQREGTGLSVSIGPLPAFVYLEIQHRPELAQPAGALTNRLVRQAFTSATDRPGLNEVMTGGASPIADSWLRPGTPLRRDAEAGIPQFPYDPARAQQLLAQAGWVKGADGALANSQTGERFVAEFWANTKAVVAGDRQGSIIAQNWKQLGADFTIHPIPAALANDREYGSKYPTISITRTPDDNFLDRMDSRFIAGPANDWSGRNKMGYVNPRVDGLLDRIAVAVEPTDRAQVARELAQELMGDAAVIPLYWEAHPVIAAPGVKATTQPNNAGWDAFTWDKR
ncbi:MAG: peptide/nickel transport system substrate-binding protein [Chloroflexota bacterium]|nr:peptide/nickel transport system substrate-binding protein [Chloroflexota bacterium]